MKKLILLVFIFLISLSVLAQSGIVIGGVERKVDTLMHRKVAPGSMYTQMYFPDYPLNAYILTVDLNNQYNTIETFQGQDQAGKTEAMTNAYTRLKTENHVPVGSVNGNFWIVAGQGQPDELLGVSHSGSIRNGEIITDPNEWLKPLGDIGFAAIDEAKKMWIDDMTFAGKVKLEDGDEYTIFEINRIRRTNELVFFNKYVGEKTRTDNDGTEVFIKPVEGQEWSINRDIVCEVIRIEKDKGGNAIAPDESVLSGNGAAKVFLEKLQPGDRVTVNMDIYITSTGERPSIQQMVTGNALVMKDGELTIRNNNEDYNVQLYPRTGIGMSGDGKTLYLIVIDKVTGSVGANTTTMCEILRVAGATNVTSMDGGGSAQMMLGGAIINNPSDGRERAVANGLMLFATSPEEEKEIAEINFADYYLHLPARSSYTPSFLGYNKYGMLITENLEGVLLSCDPALGTIINGVTFVASSTAQTGYLTAKYDNIEIRKQVIIEEAEVKFRLESVILDDKIGYPVEVQALSGNHIYPIDPASLTWEVEDPMICYVESGVLHGINTGNTSISGTIDGIKNILKVSVEIPESDPIIFSDFSSELWSVTSNISNPVTLTSAGNGGVLNYTYSSTRSPYIQLNNSLRFYGFPSIIRFSFNPGETPPDRASVIFKKGTDTKNYIYEFSDFVPNKQNHIDFFIKDLLEDVNDLGSYPIYFNSLRFYLKAAELVNGKDYTIDLPQFLVYYSEDAYTGVSFVEKDNIYIYPNPLVGETIYITSDSEMESLRGAELYSLSGVKVKEKHILQTSDSVTELYIGKIPSGHYILKLTFDSRIATYKLIIN